MSAPVGRMRQGATKRPWLARKADNRRRAKAARAARKRNRP